MLMGACMQCSPVWVMTACVVFLPGQLLLPDGLHPNAAGMEYVAQCLEKVIAPIMEQQLGPSAGGVRLQEHPPVLFSPDLNAMP